MEKLDIDSLLDKNPQVDREAIKRRQEKVDDKKPDTIKGNPASPYGGRRATTDTRLKPSLVRKSSQRTVV
jgi:hypothetical protein